LACSAFATRKASEITPQDARDSAERFSGLNTVGRSRLLSHGSLSFGSLIFADCGSWSVRRVVMFNLFLILEACQTFGGFRKLDASIASTDARTSNQGS